MEERKLMAKVNEIKAKVWKLSRSQRQDRPTLSDFVRLINDNMVEMGLFISWDITQFSERDMYFETYRDDGRHYCKLMLTYTVSDVSSGESIIAHWFTSGSGDSQQEAFRVAMTGSKEMFLMHFFDVPLREIDASAIIRAEYEARENERKAKLKKILDQIHVKVQQTLFEKPEMRKKIDDLVMQFARVNGRPSASYYAITTLEVAEALQDHLDNLLNEEVV